MAQSNGRTWIAGTIGLIVLLVLGSHFLLIKPVHDSTEEIEGEIETVQAQNTILRRQVNQLIVQEQNLPEIRTQITELQVGMPAEEQVDAFLLIIEELAVEHDVFVAIISASAPAIPGLVEPVGLNEEPEPSTTESGAPEPSIDSEEENTPTSTQRETEIPGWFAIGIGIEVLGDPGATADFVNSLQLEITRHYLVTELNINVAEQPVAETGGRPALEVGQVTVQITGQIYVLTVPDDVQLVPEDEQEPPTEPAPLPTPDANRNPYQPYGGTGGSGGGGTSAGDDD